MATPSVFDLASAQRIAAAVRRVEIGDRSEAALRFRRIDPQQQRKVFRIATFSGAWSIGATKTVEFKYVTNTPNTAVVTNLFLPLPDLGIRDCAIARDGTVWFLIQAQFDAAQIVSGVSLTTSSLEFTRYEGMALGTAQAVTVSITTCPSTTQ